METDSGKSSDLTSDSMNSFQVLSIDPGPVNLGWSFGSYELRSNTLTFSDCGVESVMVGEDGRQELIKNIRRLATTGNFGKYVSEARYVLIEHQMPDWDRPLVYMSVKNQLIQVAMSVLVPDEKLVTTYSSAVKGHYHIATGKNAGNKLAVYNLVKSWMTQGDSSNFWSHIDAGRRHHVADSIIQTVYFLEVSNKHKIEIFRWDENTNHIWKTFQELSERPTRGPPPHPSSPEKNHVKQNKRNRRIKPQTSRKRVLQSFFSSGGRDPGCESGQQHPGQPE